MIVISPRGTVASEPNRPLCERCKETLTRGFREYLRLWQSGNVRLTLLRIAVDLRVSWRIMHDLVSSFVHFLPPGVRDLPWRAHPLDGKLLLFERNSGLNILLEGMVSDFGLRG
jgi:hypothetical protein